jgi:hypothetical protein
MLGQQQWQDPPILISLTMLRTMVSLMV